MKLAIVAGSSGLIPTAIYKKVGVFLKEILQNKPKIPCYLVAGLKLNCFLWLKSGFEVKLINIHKIFRIPHNKRN